MYSGGYYSRESTFFLKLDDLGIHVSQKNRFYPYFLFYDFESILQRVETESESNSSWTHKHVPVSFSLASDVPGFEEPIFRVVQGPERLVEVFVKEINKIQRKACAHISEKFLPVQVRVLKE